MIITPNEGWIMPQESFPGHGQGGDEPQPMSGTGNGAEGTNGTGDAGHGARDVEDDFDLDASMDRLIADVDAGRIQIPNPDAWQGLTVSLAEVTDPDAADLGGFAQGGAADTMAPSAVLTALAEAACASGTLGNLTDNQVLGLAGAGKRIAAFGTWIEMTAASEFAGRRRSGDKPGTVAGENLTEFAGDELAPELGMTPFAAAQHLGYARDVTRRLPATFAALRAGRVDAYRVKIIAEATQWLSDEDAAEADQVLGVSAAQLTYGRLRNAAARLVLMLDPEAAARRKHEAAGNARVSCFREEAGTAGLSGRDLPPAETFASWAHVKARARAYRAAGMAGTIAALRAKAFLDLLQEHDARGALSTETGDSTDGTGPADGAAHEDAGSWDEADHEDETEDDRERTAGDQGRADEDGGTDQDGEPGNGGTGLRPDPASPAGPGSAARTPPAALINITVPLATLLGASGAPGEVAGFGLMDAESIRDLAATASNHPITRWCVTVIGADGTAAAHGCAPGCHPYQPDQHHTGGGSGGSRGNGGSGGNRDGPAQSRDGEFLRRLRIQLAPIAKGTCDHASYEPRYRPSRKLKHLMNARTIRCHFRGCSQPAADCDADHTVPWPAGPTCQCNLGPPCRHHHKCKQDPGWTLTQAEPGVMVWRNPAGRIHTTKPTVYPI